MGDPMYGPPNQGKNMDKKEFTALYDQWFALHPFKKRDWHELGKVHYQAFSRESVALMTEALGQLTEEQSTFPSPADIRKKLNQLSSSKTEGGEVKTNVTSHNETLATRLLEHIHGVEYEGRAVQRPDGVPYWVSELVESVNNQLPDDCPMNVRLARVGLAVAQGER
jgi:hypothetical protein